MIPISELAQQLTAVNARWVAQANRTQAARAHANETRQGADLDAFRAEEEAKFQLDGERHELLLQASPIVQLLVGAQSCLTLLSMAKGVEDGWLYGLPGAGKQKIKGGDIEDLELALDALKQLQSLGMIAALEAAYLAHVDGVNVVRVIEQSRAWDQWER